MFEKVHKLSHQRIFRILIWALIIFVVINFAIDFALPSYAETLRASETLLSDNVCNFTSKDFTDIQNKIQKSEKPKLYLLGDSVSYGIGVKNESESISGYLRGMLPDYEVLNISTCGSKPLDYHLWIQHLSKIDSNNDSIFLIQYNYKWFNLISDNLEDKISQKKILYNFIYYLDNEIIEGLGFDYSWVENVEHYSGQFIPSIGYKTELLIEIFNEKSKEDFVENLFFGKSDKKTFEYKSQNWRQKDEFKNFKCKIAYSDKDWNSDDNFNFEVYLKTLDLIRESQKRSIVYLPAYNNELIKKCNTQLFQRNVDLFSKEAEMRSIPNFEMINEIEESRFLDDMHLDKEGNKNSAQIITNRIKSL